MKDSTRIILIVDSSGSMHSSKSDTIGGVNSFIEDQRKLGSNATLTLVEFNSEVEEKLVGVPIDEVGMYTDYYPGGMTALYDAIGITITKEGARLAALPESERPNKVIVGIITDGEENVSTEYKGTEGREAVKRLIEQQQNTYNWTIEFLGANLDVAAQGATLGVVSFQSYESVRGAYATLSNSTKSVRGL